VDLAKDLKMDDIKPNLRIALTNDSYTLHKILPSKVNFTRTLPSQSLLTSHFLYRWTH